MESTSTTHKKTWYEKYETSIKMFLPFRWGKDRNKEALQDEKIGCFSYVSLHWMNGHMWRASRTQLNVDRLKDIRKRNGVQINTHKLKTMWSEEIKTKGPANASLFRTICKFNMWRLIIAAIFITSMAICNYVGPTWVLYKMLQCLSDPHIPISQGVIWAIVFSVTQIVRHLMFNAFWVTSAYAGIKITAALQGLIYDKIFIAKTNGDIDMAEVVSFFTSDLERIYQLLQSMILLVPPPFITVTHIVYTYTLLGPWTLLGNAVMLLYAPFMIFVTKMAGKYRSNAVKMADKRIGIMNQLLNNVKFIKMMTWENDFFEIVKEARDGESKSLKKAIFLQSISWSTVVIAGNLALVLSTIGYLLTGGILETIPILNLMSAYAAMATPLGTVVLSVKAISEGLISCRRLQKFLTPAEDDDPVATPPNDSQHSIVITNMSVGWGNDKTQTSIKKINNNNPKTINHADQCKGEINLAYESTEDLNERQSVLTYINLCIPRGQLVGVCGNVGSGKSTLLSSICGSTTILNGDIKVNGSIALVTQQAWIFSGTVQKNIIFGLPLDSVWYEQVIDVCCLRTDLKLMANGDQTEIGERGANLSGGQKQRINLARAVYSNRDIYLLDDPLSAVDAKVAKHIFNNCIQGCLSQKTVLLLTHNTQFLSKCEYVVIMQNGTIRDQGTHSTLVNNNQEYARMCQQTNENKDVQDKQDGKNTVQTILSKEDVIEEGKNEEKMIKAEVDNKSTIALRTLMYFCRQCGGYFMSLLLFLSVVLFSATSVFNNVWYKIWLSADDRVTPINSSVNNSMNETVQLVIDVREPLFYPYFAVYVCSMAGLCIFAIVKGLLIRHSILKGSTRLHMQMFWKVVRSPMSFFDSTPQGRIVNRFSRDMDELDVHIPSIGEYVGQTLFIVTFQAIVVCNLYPLFTIALVIIIVIFIVFDKLFTASVQETKRMDNLLKPPVINHLNTTAQGLEVIKCYNKQQLFVEIFTDLVEQHLSPYLQYQLSSKWFSFRVDIIGWVAITVLALMIMLTKSTMAVLNGGLSLVLIIQACIILSVAMRFKSEFEAKLTSLERICDYCTGLVEEAPAIIEANRPSDQWPSNGMIEFRDVYLKYRPETPLVLQGLTVTIRACEKVGIIGRTGAGKSSVIASILRLTEVFEGSIIIDDMDISKIGLEDLRSNMAVIPQEPVLFDGTVRWNLDPSNKYSDEEIWDALEKSHLKIKILNEPSGLQTSFYANGGMFSVGEKQLFCLARALLKKSKILLLDEATANVDYETDKLIQESIRSCFSNCTVLTIAHRLNTIIDYDKIMTMEAGKVIEFDTPTNLLERESQFRSMLNAQ